MSDVSEFFAQVTEKANQDALDGMNCVYQFDITGDGGGKWNIAIANNAVKVVEGAVDNPSITLTMSGEDFASLVQGNLNGQTAFLTGKLKIEGDMGLAMKLGSLFSLG